MILACPACEHERDVDVADVIDPTGGFYCTGAAAPHDPARMVAVNVPAAAAAAVRAARAREWDAKLSRWTGRST